MKLINTIGRKFISLHKSRESLIGKTFEDNKIVVHAYESGAFQPLLDLPQGTALVDIDGTNVVIQNAAALMDRKPEINWISVFNKSTAELGPRVPANIVLYSDNLGPAAWLGIRKSGTGERVICYDPIEQSERWGHDFDNVMLCKYAGSGLLLLVERAKSAVVAFHAMTTQGKLLWSTHSSDVAGRLSLSPDFRVDAVDYVSLHHVFILCAGDKLFALDGATGQPVWHAGEAVPWMRYVFAHQNSGMLYSIREFYEPPRTRRFVFQVIDSGTGKTEILHDLFSQYPGNYSNYGTSKISSHGDDLYFSLLTEGILCKMDRRTGVVTERYDNGEISMGAPVLHDGQLFITHGDDDYPKLLVFSL